MPVYTDPAVRSVKLPSAEFIFGSAPGMRELREKIERAADDDLPVLIEGESGTGKEVIAQFVHTHSARKNGAFLKLNCAAVPLGLLEGEMFGYESIDGGQTNSEFVGVTSGGTLFLDDIVNMDLVLQQKLSRAVRSGGYQANNGRDDRRVNVRFVGATIADMEAASKNRMFLAEFLSCFAHRMWLLPLRERKEDIPELCEYLLRRFACEFGRPIPRLSSDALEAFQQWRWPGNVRELENWIARVVIFGAEEAIGREFTGHLLASEEKTLRSPHGVKMKMGRARRLRRLG